MYAFPVLVKLPVAFTGTVVASQSIVEVMIVSAPESRRWTISPSVSSPVSSMTRIVARPCVVNALSRLARCWFCTVTKSPPKTDVQS